MLTSQTRQCDQPVQSIIKKIVRLQLIEEFPRVLRSQRRWKRQQRQAERLRLQTAFPQRPADFAKCDTSTNFQTQERFACCEGWCTTACETAESDFTNICAIAVKCREPPGGNATMTFGSGIPGE
jgi:hypothetical protein